MHCTDSNKKRKRGWSTSFPAHETRRNCLRVDGMPVHRQVNITLAEFLRDSFIHLGEEKRH